MSKSDVWMPLFIGPYLRKTGRLTTEQHGAYLLLLMDYWVNGAPADDDEELAAITRLGVPAWRKIRPKIAPFFDVLDGRWRQLRADHEIERAAKLSAARSEAGSKGGRPRKPSKNNPESTEKPNGFKNGQKEKQTETPLHSEEEDPSESSSIRGRGRSDERADGSSSRTLEPDDTERGWLIDANRADAELLRCRRSDPDRASELEEFMAFAKQRAQYWRSMRLQSEIDA